MKKKVTGVRGINRRLNTALLQPHSYVVRGHEIKEVAVAGVEGHDVVDRFDSWQLQCPLISHGHVRQEGHL